MIGASTASSAVVRIEKLLKKSPIEITNEVKLRAAQRAIDQKAPFHRKKNSINDALLIETYNDIVLNKNSVGIRFAFVTHNTQDFSNPAENNRLPHPDIMALFSKRKSLYFISLAEAVHRVQPDLVSDIMLEHDEWSEDPRGLSEILDAEKELTNKIWYNRHHNWLHKIAT